LGLGPGEIRTKEQAWTSGPYEVKTYKSDGGGQSLVLAVVSCRGVKKRKETLERRELARGPVRAHTLATLASLLKSGQVSQRR